MVDYDKLDDYAQDHYDDLRLEYKLRGDYDDFLEYYADVIETLTDAYIELKNAHEHYGWEMPYDIKEIMI